MVASCALGAAVAGAAMLGLRGPDRGVTPSGPPAAPAGMKWVGVGRSVFAVPKSWPVRPGIYCGSPDGHDYVTVVSWAVAVGCAPFLHVPGEPQGHVLSLAVEASGAARLEDSSSSWALGYLPKGWLAVPAGAPSGGVGEPNAADEAGVLRRVGFRVVTARVPAWGSHPPAVTTVPEMGTPAKVGSRVVVQEHVATLADSGLTGRLLSVGGPWPGTARPHAGGIHVRGNGYDEYVAAMPDGTWRISLPPGSYTVTGATASYESGASDACRAPGSVTVSAHQTVTADVYCQIK